MFKYKKITKMCIAILKFIVPFIVDEDPNFKQLLKNIIGKTQEKKVGKISFNGTATLKDTEELDQVISSI